MRTLTIQPLEKTRIAQCFPLVHLAVPSLTVAGWLEFANGHLSNRHSDPNGILVAQVEEGCILGLIVYQFDRLPALGRTFLVKHLIVHDYFTAGRRMVERSLIDAAEDLAREQGCQAISFIVPLHPAERPSMRLHEGLESLGHRVDAVSYCKPLSVRDWVLRD